ncbi:MAG: response regulator [Chloroflexi bacterium]|nr:response regulator [Chloroflexota bacterium]
MSLILYVEDHPPARSLMQAIVQDLTSDRLIAVGTCAEARQAAVRELPDLYVIDLDLPDGDGFALARELKKLHDAPAIITSAYDPSSVEPARDLEYLYLRKPLDPDDVARILQRTAARRG